LFGANYNSNMEKMIDGTPGIPFGRDAINPNPGLDAA
jgi:hypothetical protein